MSNVEAQVAVGAKSPIQGIGGWLVLPTLGLIATVVLQVVGIGGLGDTLKVAGELGGFRGALIVVETAGNLAVFLAFPVLLLIQLFQKKRNFPRLFVTYCVVGAVFFFADMVIGYAAFADVYRSGQVDFFDQDTLRGMVSALAGLLIWTPYMLNSARVKNTFVN